MNVNRWLVHIWINTFFSKGDAGVQWLIGRCLTLHRRVVVSSLTRGTALSACVIQQAVSFTKTHYPLLSTGSTQEDSSHHD